MSIRSVSIATVLALMSGVAVADAPASQPAPLGSTWADAAKMPDFFTGMWMTFSGMVESDEKLLVPFTPQAKKYADAFKAKRDIPYAQDGCLSPGLPISMRTGPVKFTFAPGLVSIYMQSVGHTRFIKLNQPQGKTSPKYYGNSVGHWEGDTLVVETADFLPEITFQYGIGKGLPPEDTIGTGNLPPPIVPGGIPPGFPGGPPAGPGGFPPPGAPPGGFPPPGAPPGGFLPPGPPPGGIPGGVAALSKAIWGPHGEGMHMVERMRLVNPETLEVALTIYDDTVWTQPFVTATRNYHRVVKGVSELGPFSGEPEEWVCTVSITSFDPESNTYVDKDPEEMVKYLDKLGR